MSGLVIGVIGSGRNGVGILLDDAPNLGVADNGDNTLAFKWDFNQATLLNSAVVVGWGSSTMNGSGADDPVLDVNGQIVTPYKLSDRLEVWVRDFITSGVYHKVALSGLYTERFLSDEANTGDIDQFRNIDAILSLNPKIVVLSLPSNDIDETATNQEFVDNLIAIDNRCRDHNVILFVEGTQPRTAFTADKQQRLFEANAMIKTYFGARCIDVFGELADPYSEVVPADIKIQYSAGDGIHVNNDGHAYIFAKAIDTITNFIVNKNFIKYVIERSLSPTDDFEIYADNLTNSFAANLPRLDGNLYYYRMRALRQDGTYTKYSRTVSMQQSIYAGSVLQSWYINCGVTGFAVGGSPVNGIRWNDFLPSGDIANVGDQAIALLDSLSNVTAIGMQVTGDYPSFGTNGKTSGTIYPSAVSTSYWSSVRSSSVAASLQNAKFKITGLNNAFLYTIKIFPCRASQAPDRYLSAQSQGRIGYIVNAAGPATGNVSDEVILTGLKPVGGEIIVYVRGMVNGQVHQNAVVVQRHDNTDSIDFTASVAKADSKVFTINGIPPDENILLVNFTGPADSGVSPPWNDINVVANQTFPLLNYLGAVDALTLTINGISASVLDNGAGYFSTDIYPASVMRHIRFRTAAFLITVGGCDLNSVFEIRLMASRLNSNTVTRFTIGAAVQTVNVNSNAVDIVFSNIAPDVQGRIIIDVRNNTSGTGHINAMVIKRFPVTLGISFDAPVAKADSKVFNVLDTGEIPFDAPVAKSDSKVFTVQDTGPISFDAPLALVTSKIFNVTTPGGTSPSTYTNSHPYYQNTLDAWVFEPIGFNDAGNTNKYPMGIYLHGAGGGDTIDEVNTNGYASQLNGSDRPAMLWICPQGGNIATWNTLRVFEAYKYMRNRYPNKIKFDQVFVTGLSLGGGGCYNVLIGTSNAPWGANKDLFAAIVPISPVAFAGTLLYSDLVNTAIALNHGTADAGATGPGQSTKILQNLNPLVPRESPLITMYWGITHSGTVWNTNVYSRYNKTNNTGVINNTGTARWDFIEWLLKHSTDQLLNATYHVDFAEQSHGWTEQYLDYLLALRLVNNLSGSAEKTALLTRLTSLKATIDNGGRRWIIDFGESDKTTAGADINNIINGTTGALISNLVRDDGSASVVGFQFVIAMSTDVNGINGDSFMNASYHGLAANTFRDGMLATAGISGRVKFVGLDNARKYEVLVFHTSVIPSDFNQQSNTTVTIGATTKTVYSGFNTSDIIRFGRAKGRLNTAIQNSNTDQSVSPVAGEIIIDISASAARNSMIQCIILYEIP